MEYQLKQNWKKNGIVSVYERLREKLGFNISSHILRRTAARRWYENGMDLKAIQSRLGHDKLTTTMEYIGIDINPEYAREEILKHSYLPRIRNIKHM